MKPSDDDDKHKKKTKKKGKSDSRKKIDPKEKPDDRFDTTKPQFRPRHVVAKQSKVVLDERFSSILTDPKFQLDIQDKYGRGKKKKKKNGKKKGGVQEELSAFYEVVDNKTNDEDEKHVLDKEDGSQGKPLDEDDSTIAKDSDQKNIPKADSDEEGAGDDVDDKDPASRIAYLRALSRGELDVSSSSEEDEDEEDEEDSDEDPDSDEDDGDKITGKAGILDPSYKDNEEEVEITYDATCFLAALNLDWAHVRATDIYAIVSSFTPPGSVVKVEVFPSDYGMEKMAQEETYGPSANIWKKAKKAKKSSPQIEAFEESDDEADDAADSDNDDGDDNDKDPDDDSDSINEEDEEGDYLLENFLPKDDHVESDFDPEKLRAYEASRLKYYFAVIEFSSTEAADTAYKEVDGMEFEHSSASLDLRSIPAAEIPNVTAGRTCRDKATSLPSNYVPPEFIVNALQQTNVTCTWEMGDTERERSLTKYVTAGKDWKSLAESDDLRAYLASDQSSDEGEEEPEGSDEDNPRESKASKMRKLLGLDSGDEGSDDNEISEDAPDGTDDDFFAEAPMKAEDSDESEREDQAMEIRYTPGSETLSEKIRSKLEAKDEPGLTPWEKYQQKRKEKRREKKLAARAKREEINRNRLGYSKVKATNQSEEEEEEDDDFFATTDDPKKRTKRSKDRKKSKGEASNSAELELLVAGDDGEEDKKNFDMRGLERIEKNKDKKLRGARKRKEAELASNVPGTDFKIDVSDDRFKALLDGQDERFGIDRTDPKFKDTAAMRDILGEQSKRRKKKKRRKEERVTAVVPEVKAESSSTTTSAGSKALTALVGRLKTKVRK